MLIKIIVFYLVVSIISLILQSKSKQPYSQPTEPDKAPEPQTDKKYYCVSWNLKTGEVTEHETE